MRRIVKTAAALVLVAGAPGLASVAFAHGGSYRGPAGEVPPDAREPSDPPPEPEGGGPSTPGGDQPSGPATGGPDAGGPSAGGGSSGGAMKKMQRIPASAAPRFEDWTLWWQFAWDDVVAAPA